MVACHSSKVVVRVRIPLPAPRIIYHNSHFNAFLAQLVEQLTCNEQVVGSIPAGGSIKIKDSTIKIIVLSFIFILLSNI